MDLLKFASKNEVAKISNDIKTVIIEGEINSLEALKYLKILETAIGNVLKDKEVESVMIHDAEGYHKEDLEGLYGCEYLIRETGVKYDYSKTDDTVYYDLVEKKKKLDKEIKDREAFLKSVTGEVYNADGVMLSPPIKSSKTKVVLTLK